MAGKHGLNMLLSQYSKSQNLKDYISCFLEEFAEVHVAIADSIKYRRLADSFGVMVDDIAYLVGASRIIYGAAALGFFGFYTNPGAEPAGDDNNPAVGGILRSDSDRESGDFVRTDVQLKAAIRARVIKTITNCYIEDLLDFCDLVIGRPLDLEITEGFQSLDFRIHGTLSVAEKVLLSYMIPDIKPAGISATLEDDAGSISLVFGSALYPPDNI